MRTLVERLAGARDAIALGVLLGAGFGLWNLVATRLDPLADDTPAALLRFYGPMFVLWGVAGFAAARRSGSVLEGAKFATIVALATFVVFSLANLVRVNLFLDAVSQRSDWQNMRAMYERSGSESYRAFVNYYYFVGVPFKILVGTGIGAVMGLIGATLGKRKRATPAAG